MFNETEMNQNESIYLSNHWVNTGLGADTFYYYLKGSGFSTLGVDINTLTAPTGGGSITVTIEGSKDPDNDADAADYIDITDVYFGETSWTAAQDSITNDIGLDFRFLRVKIVTTDPGANTDGAWDINFTQTSLPVGGGHGEVELLYNTADPTLSDGDTYPIRGDVNGRQLVTASGDTADNAADGGNPVKVGGVYNSSAPTYSNGDRADLQVNENGDVIVAGYNRVDDVIETYSNNQHSLTTSGYIELFSSEAAANATSPTVPNDFFYKHYQLHFDVAVAGGTSTGTLIIETKTSNMSEWVEYTSISIAGKTAGASYAFGASIAEPLDEIRVRIEGSGNCVIDGEIAGRGA